MKKKATQLNKAMPAVFTIYAILILILITGGFIMPEWWVSHKFTIMMSCYITAMAIMAVHLANLILNRQFFSKHHTLGERASFLLLIASMSLIYSASIMITNAYFDEGGATVPARAYKVSSSSIMYKFPAPPYKEIYGNSIVDEDYIKDIKPGSMIQVQYIKADPALNRFITADFNGRSYFGKAYFLLGGFQSIAMLFFLAFLMTGVVLRIRDVTGKKARNR